MTDLWRLRHLLALSAHAKPTRRMEISTETLVMLAVGLALVALGALLSTKEKVAHWGLTHGRGRIWVKLLGMERALKLTRYVFGPFLGLLGLAVLAASLLR